MRLAFIFGIAVGAASAPAPWTAYAQAPGPQSGPQAPAADSIVYRLVPASRLDVKTGKAGLFGFAGHEHLIRARAFSGRVVLYPAAPTDSHVEITVLTDSLEVLTPPDTAEIRKVTEAMRTETLRTAQYPEISFTTRGMAPPEKPGVYDLLMSLTIVGKTRAVPVTVSVDTAGDTLRARGTFSVKQTDFGIKPYSGGPGGTVKVADRVTFDFEAVAVREPALAVGERVGERRE